MTQANILQSSFSFPSTFHTLFLSAWRGLQVTSNCSQPLQQIQHKIKQEIAAANAWTTCSWIQIVYTDTSGCVCICVSIQAYRLPLERVCTVFGETCPASGAPLMAGHTWNRSTLAVCTLAWSQGDELQCYGQNKTLPTCNHPSQKIVFVQWYAHVAMRLFLAGEL